jgi:hypothetical protein
MPDTVRSRADLLTLLADNTTGNISPQRIRDFVVSTLGVYGSIYVHNTGGNPALYPSQVVTSSSAKLTLFDTDGASDGVTPVHASDHLAIVTDGVYELKCLLSIYGDARMYTIELRKNGIALTGGIGKCSLKNTGDSIQMRAEAPAHTCAPGDLITVYIASDGPPATMTVYAGTVTAHRIA